MCSKRTRRITVYSLVARYGPQSNARARTAGRGSISRWFRPRKFRHPFVRPYDCNIHAKIVCRNTGQARSLNFRPTSRETIPPLSKSAGMHNNRMQITKSPALPLSFHFRRRFYRKRETKRPFVPFSPLFCWEAHRTKYRKENNAKARAEVSSRCYLRFSSNPRFLEHGDSVPFHPPFRVILALPE